MRRPCCDKHKETKKRTWKEVQENQKMNNYVQRHSQSCRLSWRRNFGEDEEQLIIKLHALLGNRWSLIAGRLPGRTENEIQNYWNSYLKRKLMNMGINPDKHHVNQSMNLRPSSSSNDRKSDGTSCVDDRNACVLPDLNLELSMFTAPPPCLLSNHVEPMQHVDESKVAMRLEDESSPVTLSLFR